jgi:hypothetical protein
MFKNHEASPGAEALVLLFLALLVVCFLATEYVDRQAARELSRYDSLNQFAPPAHLNSEEEPHRTPRK